ncbi:MAG: hypothetical protein M1820_007785 [Bogoriella megaspora]|nr:MAG: hypothetical protein M1820_007785 [Bogoriella megaspora]
MASTKTAIGPNGIDFTVYKGSPSREIVQAKTHREGLKGDEVLLRVTHSGLCGTDEHFLEKDLVLGHEGAGVVEALGPNVKSLQVGQPVAFGYQRSSCGTCSQCIDSLETFCPNRMFYGFSEFDIGSMASHIIFSEAFTYALPPSISPAAGAALMCGGATVWNVFDMFDVRSTQRVGVIGLGGLGHLAVQFARKVGCEVVVFSSTEDKREEAIQYGAHEFFATKGVDSFEGKVRPIHHLIVCASFQVPWDLYLPILYKPASIYPLTVSFDELRLPYVPWLFGGVRVQASIVAPRSGYRRMLEFAALHSVRATIERYPLDKGGIERAMQDLRDGKTRYKAILYADGED